MATEAQKGGPEVLKKVREIVEQSCTRERICGVCLSTAGIVDVEKGTILYAAPLIPDYTGIAYKETLENQFQIPCEVENDVNCAGLAEYISGAAVGSRIALMLTVGTGIGGSALLDGKIFRGTAGSACEVGYMHMGDSDFQTLGAGSILTKKVAGQKQEPEECWSGRRIFQEAKKGDALCIRAIDEMAAVLGRGIANICYVLNPEVVVLGGGIMEQREFLEKRIRASLEENLLPSIAAHTRLAFAIHGNDAGMLGAFYHFRRRQSEKEHEIL